MIDISIFENLPEISLLKDEEITLEGIQNELVNDYEVKYQELTGEELILYPAEERRILLNIIAGKLYQLAEIMDARHKLNFLPYMFGEFTKNWGANFGFFETGLEAARTSLQFVVSEIQSEDIVIPKGTRATAGDNVYFATDEEVILPQGSENIEVSATCTECGVLGNDYVVGQINIIVDPINYIAAVSNTTISNGGHDEFTNDELKEKIINFPSSYAVAGSEDGYVSLIKEYSEDILDVKVIAGQDAVVKAYIIITDSILPSEEYCSNVLEFVNGKKASPDTDKIEILRPDEVIYSLELIYYIDESKRDMCNTIEIEMKDAVEAFVAYTESHIGRNINPGMLVSYANVIGASRVDIVTPVYTEIEENQVARCESIDISFGGFLKE